MLAAGWQPWRHCGGIAALVSLGAATIASGALGTTQVEHLYLNDDPTIVYVIVMVSGIVIVLLSLFGFLALCKPRKCCTLAFYIWLPLLFCVAFIFSTAVLFRWVRSRFLS